MKPLQALLRSVYGLVVVLSSAVCGSIDHSMATVAANKAPLQASAISPSISQTHQAAQGAVTKERKSGVD